MLRFDPMITVVGGLRTARVTYMVVIDCVIGGDNRTTGLGHKVPLGGKLRMGVVDGGANGIDGCLKGGMDK